MCFPPSPSSSLFCHHYQIIGKGESYPVLVMTPFRFPDRSPPSPVSQPTAQCSSHNYTETHKETLTVEAGKQCINSPKRRQRDDDLEQSWELCFTYDLLPNSSARIVKEGPSAPTAPFPLCLNAWCITSHNLRIFTHSFIHQTRLNESAVSPVSAVREILRQMKNHLCPQGSWSLFLQTSKKAIMQCDWTSSTRENKLLRKHLGWTLNPGARRRKVGRWKRVGQCIQDQTALWGTQGTEGTQSDSRSTSRTSWQSSTDSMLSMQRAWVQSLGRELRSYMLHGENSHQNGVKGHRGIHIRKKLRLCLRN